MCFVEKSKLVYLLRGVFPLRACPCNYTADIITRKYLPFSLSRATKPSIVNGNEHPGQSSLAETAFARQFACAMRIQHGSCCWSIRRGGALLLPPHNTHRDASRPCMCLEILCNYIEIVSEHVTRYHPHAHR